MFHKIDEPTYSIADAQDILGKDKSTIYRMINKHILPTLEVRPLRVTRGQLRSAMLNIAPKASVLWQEEIKI